MNKTSATFLGPWKMTYATTDAKQANAFAMRHLRAADFGRSRSPCGDIQWAYWPEAPVRGPNAARFDKEAGHLHLHFVEHTKKPTGPLSIGEYERLLLRRHRGLTPHDAFVHPRMTVEALSLSPLMTSLEEDRAPYLLLQNPSGSLSLFLEVPTGLLLEVIAPLATATPRVLSRVAPWHRCGTPVAPPSQNASRPQTPPATATIPSHAAAVAPSSSRSVLGIWRSKRFVYASRDPARSAAFAARYLGGVPSNATIGDVGAGPCLITAAVRWPAYEPPFEMVWVRSEEQDAGLHLGDMPTSGEESYRHALNGNLSAASPKDWHHYMDYHGGLLFDDCDPLLRKLTADRVPYFRGRHGCDFSRVTANGRRTDSCMSIFFADESSGMLHEAMCHSFSLRGLEDVPPWESCSVPSAAFQARIQAVRPVGQAVGYTVKAAVTDQPVAGTPRPGLKDRSPAQQRAPAAMCSVGARESDYHAQYTYRVASPSAAPTRLMVIAHPDDETIFGGSELFDAHAAWHSYYVVSVTNACSKTRRSEFLAALNSTRAVGGGEIWGFADTYEGGWSSPEKSQLAQRLTALLGSRPWAKVVTHGRAGEYGHLQHRQLHALVRSAVASRQLNLYVFARGDSALPLAVQAQKRHTLRHAHPSQAREVLRAHGDYMERTTAVPWDAAAARTPAAATLSNDGGGGGSGPGALHVPCDSIRSIARRRRCIDAGAADPQLAGAGSGGGPKAAVGGGGGGVVGTIGTGMSPAALLANRAENRHQPRGAKNFGLRWGGWRLPDRLYMKAVTFPRVQALFQAAASPPSRASGGGAATATTAAVAVLSLGARGYSGDDRYLAGVPQSQWFFADPDPEPLPEASGRMVMGPLSALPTLRPELQHTFIALIDYGVLGALAKNGKWSPTDIAHHVVAYDAMLRDGGRLFLKWDWQLDRYPDAHAASAAEQEAALDRDVSTWQSVVQQVTHSLCFRFLEEVLQLSPSGCPASMQSKLERRLDASGAASRVRNETWGDFSKMPCGFTYAVWERQTTRHDSNGPTCEKSSYAS